MNNKKLICLFIMTLCVSSCEALAKEPVLNKHDLFLNHSDIPKTLTAPNQEALDKFNKNLNQEAANHYKQNIKPGDPSNTFKTPYQDAVSNYNKNLKPDSNNKYGNSHENRIEIPILKW